VLAACAGYYATIAYLSQQWAWIQTLMTMKTEEENVYYSIDEKE